MKNVITLAALIGILCWLWFPNFTPEDIITFGIIAHIGLSMYIILSVILIFLAYNIIDGKTLKDKFNNIKKGLKKVI